MVHKPAFVELCSLLNAAPLNLFLEGEFEMFSWHSCDVDAV